MSKVVADQNGYVPQQFWYDNLRETDDGRFSMLISPTKVNSQEIIKNRYIKSSISLNKSNFNYIKNEEETEEGKNLVIKKVKSQHMIG